MKRICHFFKLYNHLLEFSPKCLSSKNINEEIIKSLSDALHSLGKIIVK